MLLEKLIVIQLVQNQLAQALICIRDIPGWNLGQSTMYISVVFFASKERESTYLTHTSTKFPQLFPYFPGIC
jgi:hypothetical protein